MQPSPLWSATMWTAGKGLTQAASISIRPGDITAVADTTRAEFNRILMNLLREGRYAGVDCGFTR